MQTAALILGILALSFLFVPGFNLVLSPMLGVSALVIGLMAGISARKKGGESHRAAAGAVTGAVALVLSMALIGGCFYMVDGLLTEQREKKSVTDHVDQRFDELSDGLRDEIRDEIRLEVREEMKKAREERAEKWIREHPDLPPDEAIKKHFEERMEDWIDWLEQMPVKPEPCPGGLHEMEQPTIAPPPPETPPPVVPKQPTPKAKKMDPTYPPVAF